MPAAPPAFATAIKDQFGQPDGFVDDVLTLAANHDGYKGAVMNPALASRADTNTARTQAVAAKPADGSPNAAAWARSFEAAGDAVLAGDTAGARRHYQAAAQLAAPRT